MTKIKNSKLYDREDLRFGDCSLEFVWNLVLVIYKNFNAFGYV